MTLGCAARLIDFLSNQEMSSLKMMHRNSCMEPHSWLFLRANLLSSGRANSCVGISPAESKAAVTFQ